MRIFLVFLVLMLSSCSPLVGGSEGSDIFLPEQLCADTSGSWLRVDSSVYSFDPANGVYDPDNHPDYNYLCQCPGGRQWSTAGCQ